MFKLPENLDSKYRFVIMSALRAEQLQAGALPRVRSQSMKATVIAQEEVATGIVGEYDPAAVDEQLAAEAEGAQSSEE